MFVVQVAFVLDEVGGEADEQEGRSGEQRAELVVGEEVRCVQVAHEDGELHGHRPEGKAAPDGDDETGQQRLPQEREHAAGRRHVGHALAQGLFVVVHAAERQHDGDVEADDAVDREGQQEEVQEESGEQLLLVDAFVGEHHAHEVRVVDHCGACGDPEARLELREPPLPSGRRTPRPARACACATPTRLPRQPVARAGAAPAGLLKGRACARGRSAAC